MLDFRVETFLCVCKYLNYTRAAEELSLTQPAVSQHIRHLEEYYGQKLFTYDRKLLKLTPAGESLRNAMLAMRHDTGHLRHVLAETGGGIRRLDWGASLSIGEFLLPELLSGFLRRHPEIQIDYHLANTERLLEWLDQGAIDFAFVEGNFPKREYDYVTIKSERFIAVCGADYELEGMGTVSHLFRHTLLLREEGSGTRRILGEYLKSVGYSFDDFTRICTMNSHHMILRLLEDNCGISFVYEIVARKAIDEGRLREFVVPGFDMRHELNFIWRKGSIYREYYLDLLEDFYGMELGRR